jgi:hypothetical protein
MAGSVDGEADMADKEHVDALRKAREQMVDSRRKWAKVLAEPFTREKTSRAIAGLIEAQQVIKILDEAIKDEASPSAHLI